MLANRIASVSALVLLLVAPVADACTSFVDYSAGAAWYGMNFDWHPDQDILFRIETGMDGRRVFTMSFIADGGPVPTAGMTEDGRFSAMQVTDAPWTGPAAGSGDSMIFWPFYALVYRGASMEDIGELVEGDTFIQLEDPPIHVIVADAAGAAMIIEVGEFGNDILERSGEPFMVMTNFSNCAWAGSGPGAVEGCGADRYRSAFKVLSRFEGMMSPSRGMAVLEAALNASRDFPTRVSMVFDASGGDVYLAPAGRFGEIWSVDIGSGRMARENGDLGGNAIVLDSTGVSVSYLLGGA